MCCDLVEDASQHGLQMNADPELHVISKELPELLQRKIERHIATTCKGKQASSLHKII